MADHEASTTVDVAPNILFDYLADIENMPAYLPRMTGVHRTGPRPDEAQGMEARQPGEPVHEDVEVTAVVPSDSGEQERHTEATIDVIEENRKLRWAGPGDSDYHGELDVDFVSDGTSKLTVRIHTGHDADPAVDEQVRRSLEGIKTALEQRTTTGDAPDA
ncbi:SRPBCC family protein [Kribbella sp. NPDC023855]|uniref:SRPBCC family protein n=1 Tax=Kribbella sp. NPDC023855 TaxID=3154698 RepID=UPI0033E8F3D1